MWVSNCIVMISSDFKYLLSALFQASVAGCKILCSKQFTKAKSANIYVAGGRHRQVVSTIAHTVWILR